MDVASVNGSTSAYTNTSLKSAESRQAQPSQAVQQQAAQAQEADKKQEQPKPVTNALGQTTGTLINVTA